MQKRNIFSIFLACFLLMACSSGASAYKKKKKKPKNKRKCDCPTFSQADLSEEGNNSQKHYFFS